MFQVILLSCSAVHMLCFLPLTDRYVDIERGRKVGSQNNMQIVIYMELSFSLPN